MYYHTAFGESTKALTAAREIRTHYLPFRNPRDRVFLGGDIGYALRVNGATDDARATFESVYRNGASTGFIAAAGVAAWYLSMMALDTDSDVALATDWISRCEALPGAPDEELLRHICAHQRARLAVIEGRVQDAVDHTRAAKRCVVDTPHPKRLAYVLALDLAIALLVDDADRIHEFVQNAEVRFSKLKGTLGQDYLASQLICALRRLGRVEEAKDLFLSYVTRSRRERSKVPKYLLDAHTS